MTNPTYVYPAPGQQQSPNPNNLGPFNLSRYPSGVVHELYDGRFVNTSQGTPFPITIPGIEVSQFGEFLTVERTPIIELNSSYGTSFLRDIEIEENGATIEDIRDGVVTGEIKLSSGTNASGRAVLRAAEIARYIPGFSAETGTGLRLPSPPTGNQCIRVGLRDVDENEGFYLTRDADTLYFTRLRDGTETSVARADWNIDKADGTGPSGFNLDLDKGVIFQFDYTWYGYGQILFGFIGVDPKSKRQRFIPCHSVDNQDFDTTSIQSPNLYIFQEVANNGTAANLELFIGGRQFAIVGNYTPKFRFASEWRYNRTSIGTTPVPLITFRRKSTFRNRSIKLAGYESVVSGQNMILEVRIGGSLTGASWQTPTNHTADETSVESDKSATAITGGVVVWQSIAVAASGNQIGGLADTDFRLDIPEGEPVTLCAYTAASTGTYALGVFRVKEEW